ncbi:MAG: riboflavin biosynthesis protein RibD [Bacteroidia bacterium]|nr:MAG: riboflavin biosynthesis protein RibD [Bacteroidia bacterium]
MRKVVFAFNFTADGYCSHTDMIADEALHDYFTAVLRKADTLLYGRVTYQLMVPYWPEVAKTQGEPPSVNEFAQVFDSLEKVVFSRTLKQIEDRNSRLAQMPLREQVLALKGQSGKDIGVGSLSLASQLSAQGLIDEYHFVIHPVVAGKGPRLFDTMKPENALRLDLVHSRTLPSGVIALHYRRHA